MVEGETGPKMAREKRTLEAMIDIFCRGRHGTADPPCPDCRELLEYAHKRLDRCTFQEDKPICAKCPVHCYRPAMREKVREVMRYAGPRMLLQHPVMALRHYTDSRRAAPGDGETEDQGEDGGDSVV